MAERKRRPSNQKIKPGTPHPTKAYTVRGYDGRWISRKAFNASKRAREAKAKGGALVKRTSSAVTKVADKAGELLKIKKGDKGIVRGIKDTYKLGKDTRRSARAAYKAGQITREVYDKLVKGGKDFFGGVKEAGKATRRAYERTKPGGKIVWTSKDVPKFNYDALPKQKGGAIVKSPKGKMVKSPGGKMVKSPGGKLKVRETVKDQKYTAPKTRNPRKGRVKVDGKTVYTKRDIKGDVKSKVKGAKSRVKSNVNKLKSNVKKSWATRPMATVKKAWTSPGKMQKITRLSRGLKSAANWKSAGIGIAADWGADQLVDRAMKPLMERKLGKKLTLSEYRSITQEVLNRKREKKVTTKDLQKGKETKNKRGRTVKTEKPVGRNWQNPYKGPAQPDVDKPNYGKPAVLKKGEEGKREQIPNAKNDGKSEKQRIDEADKLKVKKNSGGQGNQQKNQKTSNTPYWQSPRYSSVKKKKTEAELKKEWLKKTRNSPAAKSGAFTDEQRWQQHKKHQKWKKANNRR